MPRPRFQFRLRTLFIVVMLLSAVLSRLDFREPREVVKKILAADMAPEARMTALEPYINVGRPQGDIEEVLGRGGDYVGHGPGFVECSYDDGLNIEYYPDGEACIISFRGKDGKVGVLPVRRSDYMAKNRARLKPLAGPFTVGHQLAF